MGILGDLVVRIVGDDKQFKDAVGKSESKVKKFTNFLKGAAGIGGAVLIFKKLVDVAGDLVDAYKIQETAEAKLKSALKATHNAIGMSADEMFRYAKEMQQVTVMGDEAIIGAQALMTTFTKVGKNVFPEAIEAAADMSTMFGQDLQQSVIQLGTALNDPIAGIGRLKRIGISFSEEQKKSIELYMEQNDVAGAQGVILAELKNEFGGVSKAMADTATGSMQQFKNAMGDLKEAGGQMLVQGLQPVVRGLTKLVQKLAENAQKAADVKAAYIALKNLGEDEVLNEKDMLLILQDKADRLVALAASMENLDEATNKARDSALQELQAYQDAIIANKYWNDQAAEAARNRDAVAERAAKAEAKKAENIKKYLEEVAEAYARTDEGQMDALDTSIAYWESQLEGAVHTKPKVEAIIELLYDQKEALIASTEEIDNQTEAVDHLWESWQTLAENQLAAIMAVDGAQGEAYHNAIEMAEYLAELKNENAEREIETEDTSIERMYETRKKYWDGRILLMNTLYDRKKEKLAEEIEAERAAAEEMEKIQQQLNDAYISMIVSVTGSMGTVWDSYYAGLLENEALTDTQRKTILRERAIASKAMGLFQVAINTANAIVKMLVDPGGYAGAALSIMAGITGAAQAAAIASKPLPALAEGGIIHEPTVLLAGEQGPEKITPLGEEQPIVIGISIDGKALDTTITRNVGNRRILIAKEAVI